MDEILRELKGFDRVKYLRQVIEKVNDVPVHLPKARRLRRHAHKPRHFIVTAHNTKIDLKGAESNETNSQYEVQRLKLVKCKARDREDLHQDLKSSDTVKKVTKEFSLGKLATQSSDLEKQRLRELYKPNFKSSRQIKIAEMEPVHSSQPVDLQTDNQIKELINVPESEEENVELTSSVPILEDTASNKTDELQRISETFYKNIKSLSPSDENADSTEPVEASGNTILRRQNTEQNKETRTPYRDGDEFMNDANIQEESQIMSNSDGLTYKRMCHHNKRVKKRMVSPPVVFSE